MQCIEFDTHHVAIDADCIEFDAYINTRFSYPDPPALHLVCMSEEHARQKIDGLRQDAMFTEVLKLGRLPHEAQQQGQQQQQQPSVPTEGPSSSTSAGGGSSTPEEESRLAAGQNVLDATYRASKRIHGEEPPHMPGLRNVDIGFNQKYGYQSMEGIICLINYGSINGGFVPLSTQQCGACLFHAFR